MAPKSLFRHIFRHGPHAKRDGSTSPEKANEPLPEKCTALTESDSNLSGSEPIPLVISTPWKTSESPTRIALAEDSADTANVNDDFTSDTATITQTLAALNLNLSTSTTRQLFYATIDEATAALRAHLHSISSVLALLDALEGFSAAILAMEEDMISAGRECQQKLQMMEDVWAAIEEIPFADEGVGGHVRNSSGTA